MIRLYARECMNGNFTARMKTFASIVDATRVCHCVNIHKHTLRCESG